MISCLGRAGVCKSMCVGVTQADQGDPWVAALTGGGGYDQLSLAQRLAVVGRLTQAAAEGVTLRALLEWRVEEAARARRFVAEEAKVLAPPGGRACMHACAHSMHTHGAQTLVTSRHIIQTCFSPRVREQMCKGARWTSKFSRIRKLFKKNQILKKQILFYFSFWGKQVFFLPRG